MYIGIHLSDNGNIIRRDMKTLPIDKPYQPTNHSTVKQRLCKRRRMRNFIAFPATNNACAGDDGQEKVY